MPGTRGFPPKPIIKDNAASIRAGAARIESPSLASQSPPGRPTDVAVALKYTPMNPDAPRVAAAGEGAVARRIVGLAQAHDIAIRKNADLAEMLHTLAVDEEIPMAAFTIVAEILFHVMRWDARPASNPSGEQ